LSSFTRTLQRRRQKANGTFEARPRFARVNPDGSIVTLRPTKGWLRTSGPRVALRIEQARHMALLELGAVTAN
jgi:hypothetical protein